MKAMIIDKFGGTESFKQVEVNKPVVKPGHVVSITRSKEGFKITDTPFWDVNFPQAEQYNHAEEEDYYIKTIRYAVVRP